MKHPLPGLENRVRVLEPIAQVLGNLKKTISNLKFSGNFIKTNWSLRSNIFANNCLQQRNQ